MATERFTLFPIVEGKGEITAVPALLHRILSRLNTYMNVYYPWRLGRANFLIVQDKRKECFETTRERAMNTTPSGVLVLFDTEDKCCRDFLNSDKGREVRTYIEDVLTGIPYLFVLAEKGYESWLVAGLGGDKKGQNNPERWLNANKDTAGLTKEYKKRVDQKRVTSNRNFDIDRAAAHNASFRRFQQRIREMAERLTEAEEEKYK